jgi:hypothetical protein
MPLYEVKVHYQGSNTYLVEAETQGEAEAKAELRYAEGDDEGEPQGDEYEEITSFHTTVVE